LKPSKIGPSLLVSAPSADSRAAAMPAALGKEARGAGIATADLLVRNAALVTLRAATETLR